MMLALVLILILALIPGKHSPFFKNFSLVFCPFGLLFTVLWANLLSACHSLSSLSLISSCPSFPCSLPPHLSHTHSLSLFLYAIPFPPPFSSWPYLPFLIYLVFHPDYRSIFLFNFFLFSFPLSVPLCCFLIHQNQRLPYELRSTCGR